VKQTDDKNGTATKRAERHWKDDTALVLTGQIRACKAKPLLHSEITSSIIDSFFDVHRELGFGFREYLYTRALERLLIAKGHNVERKVPVMVYFRGEPLAHERVDMVVDGVVILESKARERLDPDAQGQLFAGLAATNLEVGLVLHFGKKARFYRIRS
jgi:GxxExxY protein